MRIDELIEKLCVQEAENYAYNGKDVSLTLTIGVATVSGNDTVDDVIKSHVSGKGYRKK